MSTSILRLLRPSSSRGYASTIISGVDYTRNSQEESMIYLLNRNIKLVEIKRCHINPGASHSSLIKLGFKTDQLICKQLRLYGSLGFIEDAKKLFYDSLNSKTAGVAVWNAMIATLALNGGGDEAIQIYEIMPQGLSKTHATYWNVMMGCCDVGETSYAHYLFAKAFKCSGIEPTIELMGTYIEGLARHYEGEKAVRTLKGMLFKPNQEIVVSILSKYKRNNDPRSFAKDFVQYLEEQNVSFYIGKALYNELASEAGVVWKSNVKIQRRRKATRGQSNIKPITSYL